MVDRVHRVEEQRRERGLVRPRGGGVSRRDHHTHAQTQHAALTNVDGLLGLTSVGDLILVSGVQAATNSVCPCRSPRAGLTEGQCCAAERGRTFEHHHRGWHPKGGKCTSTSTSTSSARRRLSATHSQESNAALTNVDGLGSIITVGAAITVVRGSRNSIRCEHFRHHHVRAGCHRTITML